MIVEINGQNKLTDEVQIKDSIALRPRAQCDGLTAERFGNFKFPATEVNDSVLLNLSNDIIGSVLYRWEYLRKVTITNLVTAGRNFQAKGFMRTVMVITEPPRVKSSLCFFVSPREKITKQFRFKGSVKPLIFSKRLRMSGSAVTNQNSQPHKPNGQFRIR